MKTEAIKKMSQPTNIIELKRFRGMVNFFRRFVPNLADMAEPQLGLRVRINKRHLKELKKLCNPPVLALYECKNSVYLSADASSYGIGAMPYQIKDILNFQLPMRQGHFLQPKEVIPKQRKTL
ncbi:hypothetical protein AVEN_90255-1 [Araneus ventricosus]|uniref:Reverse transcriptase/retrotransposon-derived protein RNase H-like domain-containing protein n=1 Tax=Araneus ventricosus TaxID=182803 RepID=A0A4Y2G1F0_ARAVE|nr:hypothetical protein AVEN_90255-1 [Araneus ventricosus]